MQRISIEILKKMFHSHLSRCQVDFLLGISRYQDMSGHIKGVYYKDIAKEMGFSYPQFYAAMRSLEAKGIIKCEKNNYYDYDITILDNDYRATELYQDPKENLRRKPYINTKHEIFYDEAFRKLKPGAKLMAMDFMGVTRLNKGSHHIGVKKFFAKYQELLGVTERIIRVYITQLKEFFSIGIKDGYYWIRPKVKVYKDEGKTEIDNYNEQQIRTACRRERIEVEAVTEVEEVRKLIRQYGKKAMETGVDILETVLEGIKRSVDPIEEWSAERPVLRCKLVHKWVRKLIGISGGDNPAKASEPDKQKSHNKFNNFHQRDYDFEALEKAMLNADA